MNDSKHNPQLYCIESVFTDLSHKWIYPICRLAWDTQFAQEMHWDRIAKESTPPKHTSFSAELHDEHGEVIQKFLCQLWVVKD